MRTKARLWLTLALLVAATPVLSACYTARGAGEDLSAAGKSIQHSAEHQLLTVSSAQSTREATVKWIRIVLRVRLIR